VRAALFAGDEKRANGEILTLKTTAWMLLLAAAAWAQQVAVPQGGSLGPSCNLSDGATLGADKLDGSHSSATPTANTVPVAGSGGKLAPGWIPLPTGSSIGGIFMDGDCLAGNHVSGIDAASGKLKCSGDGGGDWNTLANKPSVFPPDTASTAWTDLLSSLILKAPLANAALTGTTTTEDVVASGSVQVGAGTPTVTLSYLGTGDSDPAGACSAGSEILKAVSGGSTKRFYCNAGAWAEDVPAASALGDPGANGVLKRTGANTTAVAARTDIVALWTSCTAGYLKYDGTCSTPSGTEATPALSEDSTTVTSTKSVSAPQYASTATTDQSFDLPTAVSPTLSATGHGKFSFQSNKMKVSENGGSYYDVLNANSGYAAIVAMWTTCTAGYLKYDGTCSAIAAALADPGSNGIVKRTALNTTAVAARSDVLALWTSCTTGYLKQDGTCDTPTGSESTPALSEDSTNVTSSKPIVVTGTQTDLKITEGTAKVVASENHFSFNSATHHPAYSYNGGAATDVMLAGDDIPAADLPVASTTVGGVKMAAACSSGYHISSIGAGGELTCSQDATTGGSGVNFITGGCGGTASTSAQTLGLPNLGAGFSSCSSATWATSNAGWLSTGARTVSKLHVNMGTTKNGNSYTFTLWDAPCTTVAGGVCTVYGSPAATALTCTISATGGGPFSCSDTTHNVSVAEFDTLTVKWATVASDSAGSVSLTMEVQ